MTTNRSSRVFSSPGACYHAAVMHAPLGLLATVSITLTTPTDVIHPIEVKAEHEAVDLDEEVAPTASGETPFLGLASGPHDMHFGGDGRWWHDSLLGR